MTDPNYTTNPLMYYVHPTNDTNHQHQQHNNPTMTHPLTHPHDLYYSPALPVSSAMPIIQSPSEMDPMPSHTTATMQQHIPLSIISNPLLPIATTAAAVTNATPAAVTQAQQVFDPHPQELSPQDPSIYSFPSSVIDEDVSSRNSASVNGHVNGGSSSSNSNSGGGGSGQDAYIQQLQKQVEESKHLQTQYYYRIEQLMALVEKQTTRINELQEQVSQKTAMHDQQPYSLQQTPSSIQQQQQHHHHHH